SLASPFLNTYVLAYERVLNKDMGAQLGFYYTGANALEAKFSGFAITPEFRYYLSESKTAPNGAFVAPFLRYQNFTLEDEESLASGTLTSFGGGLLVGVQRVFKETITLSAFIGPAYVSPKIDYEDPEEDFFSRDGGFWARAGINIGIMF
ncbi:MAG: DUF3575 domain-containing protein, partial [Bacteroidales bacterium]